MIRIYNRELDCIGIMEEINSFQYSLKYRGVGSFKIKTLLTEKAVKLLKVGNIVYYKDFAGFIDSIEKTQDEKQNVLTVSGSSLENLLSFRLIKDQLYFRGDAQDYLRTIVYKNAIKTFDNPNRKIPFLELGLYNNHLGKNVTRKPDGDSLLEMCNKVCEIVDYGYNIKFLPREKRMNFNVYEGRDKTGADLWNENVTIMGTEYDNVLKQDYTYSNKQEVTTCLVENDALSLVVGDDKVGFDRKEVKVKSSEKQEELTQEEFKDVLTQAGLDKLSSPVECLDVDVCNVDYLKLGDKVIVRNKAWGINFNTRVEEIQTTLQNGTETRTCLLGKDIVVKENR